MDIDKISGKFVDKFLTLGGQNLDIDDKVWTNLRWGQWLDKMWTYLGQKLDKFWMWTKVGQNLGDLRFHTASQGPHQIMIF